LSNGNLFSNSPPTRGQRLRHWVDHAVQLLSRTPPLVFAMAVLGLGLTTASGVLVKGIRKANDTITAFSCSIWTIAIPRCL
jgi:hypothetical protein